uniref:RNase H type-1 domain-containing protein n=1 Tax=Cannabis sativa TaxID=3483 RepID=A0A803NTB5_CANSA
MLQKSTATSPLEAEAKAIQMALSWAVNSRGTHICVGDHVVFIDAANKGLCSAAGIVITNSEGMVVEAFSAHCQTLVLEINSRKASDWKLTTVFRHVLMGLDHLPESTITWIPRSRNEMAHRLSKLAFNFSLFGFLNVKELAPLVSN